MKQRLEVLTRQRVAAARAVDLDDDEGGIAGGAVDEDTEREAWFLQLDLYALKVGVAAIAVVANATAAWDVKRVVRHRHECKGMLPAAGSIGPVKRRCWTLPHTQD